MKKMSTALVAGLATLAFSATAFAAISAEEAKAIAAKEVPASSTHIVTKADRDNFTPYFEVKFTAAGLRGSYTINPETGVVYEKELKYQF